MALRQGYEVQRSARRFSFYSGVRRFIVQLLVQSCSEQGIVMCNERYMVDDIFWGRTGFMVKDTNMGMAKALGKQWLSELATGKGLFTHSDLTGSRGA